MIVAASSRVDAERLVERIQGCDCEIVHDAPSVWIVVAAPTRAERLTLAHAVTAVQEWLAEIAQPTAEVVIGGRTFTLVAAVR
jgi:hypothetical protein